MTSRDTSGIAVVLAVKDLAHAKSRLTGTPGPRAKLVEAMVADTLSAVRDAGIARVLVVTPDPVVTRMAGLHGATAHPDPGGGLNPALSAGADAARRRWEVDRIAFLQADLPALTASSLVDAIEAAALHADAFVADRSGVGTALLVSTTVTPAFGPDSAAAHRSAGADEIDPAHLGFADLRCDVDTPDDLAAAQALGVGRCTATELQANGV